MVDESQEHTDFTEAKAKGGQPRPRRRRMSDGYRKYYPLAEALMILAFCAVVGINWCIAALVWNLI